MNASAMLLNAYYEILYERLKPLREAFGARMNELLAAEIDGRFGGRVNEEKYAAYLDTCMAFFDERLEAYNPTGIQYLFDNLRSRKVLELQTQLDWYDSRKEFDELKRLAGRKAETDMTDERMRELAEELVAEAGAFPDRSIIVAYLDRPSLDRLPDYILARTIEEVVGK